MKNKIPLFIVIFFALLLLVFLVVGIMYPLEGTIVFSDSGAEMYIFNTKNIHGTIREFFKTNIRGFEPCFSPNGNEVLFTKDNPLGWPLSQSPEYELMIVAREGRNFKKVLDMGEKACGYSSWAPDGSKITFLTKKNEYSGELFVSSLDGSNIRKVTDIPISVNRPSWMPDSKKIVFSSENGVIFSINYDGTDKKVIIKGLAPSVSPDGKKIAFRDMRNIYLCDIDGKNKKILVWNYDRVIFRSSYPRGGYPTEFAWSPDNKYLLYSRSTWGIFSDLVVVSSKWPHRKKVLHTIGGDNMRGFSWTKK
jgi:Tol biopolymer transport system component